MTEKGEFSKTIDTGACAKRCPVGAITTREGHDKQACMTCILETAAPYATKTYGTGATPCGLCQVKVPCESRVPLDKPIAET